MFKRSKFVKDLGKFSNATKRHGDTPPDVRERKHVRSINGVQYESVDIPMSTDEVELQLNQIITRNGCSSFSPCTEDSSQLHHEEQRGGRPVDTFNPEEYHQAEPQPVGKKLPNASLFTDSSKPLERISTIGSSHRQSKYCCSP